MAPNVGLGTEGPVQRGWPLYLWSVIMVIVAGLFVGARIAARVVRKTLGMDDYTIIASLISSAILSVTEIEAVVNGYGRHARELPHSRMITALKWFYAAQIMYKVVITLNKVSILCLYYRIFSIDKPFRYICYGANMFIISSGVAYIVATIFQCSPIRGFWDKTTKDIHCIDSGAFWMSYAVLNITTDVAILCLPIRQIMLLRLPRMDKIGLGCVFLLGAFVCVTSIVRTTTLASSAKDKDPTWGPIPATIWSVIEANSGIICACLPMLRRPLLAVFPRLFSPTHVSSTSLSNKDTLRRSTMSAPLSGSCSSPWDGPGNTPAGYEATVNGLPTKKHESQEYIMRGPDEIRRNTDISVTYLDSRGSKSTFSSA